MSTSPGKATRINLFSFTTPQMRAFHMAWLAFFVCFFAWFAIAPMMGTVRAEMKLTKDQIANIGIASVAGTIFARLLLGWLCEKIGPRLAHTWLLVIGSIPVMLIGMAHDYHTFLAFRFAIGTIGASFVITQYHTSVMFASNCVGTANATTAGWGNLGGGVTQSVMPLLLGAILSLGLGKYWGWRVAMVVPGVMMLIVAWMYYRYTQDAPAGNLSDLRRLGREAEAKKGGNKTSGAFMMALRDPRVWALSLIYGASFGIELTIHTNVGLYFIDTFKMSDKLSGMSVGAFGLLAIFARTLGGWISDKVNLRFGLSGRTTTLGLMILAEGLLLIVFSRMGVAWLSVGSLIVFGLFVHMSCGATYAVIPFVNPKAVGSVAGIVGAGGNLGAVLSGILFKAAPTVQTALMLLGVIVAVSSCLSMFVRFSPQAQREADLALPAGFEGAVLPA